jgi:pimeloyl-ACP methyl ester carboxylesterase
VNVVLLHAYPLDSRMWDPQRGALAGHDVHAPDLYDLGSSMEEWARQILRSVPGDFALVGASMGGYCALAVARLAPERIRALALVGSRADPDTPERRAGRAATIELIRTGGAAALWEDVRPKLFNDASDPEVVERARRLVLDLDPDGLVRAVRAIRDRQDSTDVVESLEVPVLIAVGDDDPYVPVADAEALAQLAPRGRIEVYQAGHLVSLEHPNEFNRALVGLLDEVGDV